LYCYNDGFSVYLWGIETLIFSCFANCCTGFQSTYEELKQFKNQKHSDSQSVFSLPMRNWNNNALSICWCQQPFSVYLWGIETRRRKCRNWRSLKFSVYLWGIETRRWIILQRRQRAFSVYLWGIETSNLTIHLYRFNQVFSLPMRNWNLFTWLIPNADDLFSVYLWGIETLILSIPCFSYHSFQSTYEELKLTKALIIRR